MICVLLGIPEADVPWMRRRASEVTAVLEPVSTPEELRVTDAAGRDLETYFAQLVAERRGHPREDVTSALATPGPELRGDELLANLVLRGLRSLPVRVRS